MYVLVLLQIYIAACWLAGKVEGSTGTHWALEGAMYIPQFPCCPWKVRDVTLELCGGGGISILHEAHARVALAKREFIAPPACLTCVRSR